MVAADRPAGRGRHDDGLDLIVMLFASGLLLLPLGPGPRPGRSGGGGMRRLGGGRGWRWRWPLRSRAAASAGMTRRAARTAPRGAAATATGPEMPGGKGSRARDRGGAIRGWIDVLNAGNHDQAANYFAPDAIVVQGQPVRLLDPARPSPSTRGCPAGPRDRRRGRGRDGRGGVQAAARSGGAARLRRERRACGSSSGDKFAEWRQMPEARRGRARAPRGPAAGRASRRRGSGGLGERQAG